MRVLLVALLCVVAQDAQLRDASAILTDMRRALGGDATLDGIRTFTVSGSITKGPAPRRSLSLEMLALLPDHFMTIERHQDSAGPLAIDITYYNGFRGDALIRRTDSSLSFPPDPGPNTPEAIAERQRTILAGHKRKFARLTLALFGRGVDNNPLQLSSLPPEHVGGRMMDVVEARAADGSVMRLYVDGVTHLPASVAWPDAPPVHIVTSSTTVISGGRVTSQSPPTPVGRLGETGPPVTWTLELSDYRTQDGVTWPRRLRVVIGNDVQEEMRLGRFRLNPKLDTRRFEIR